MKTKTFITLLAIFALVTFANAQDNTAPGQAQQASVPFARGAFIDTNNNGICDNFESFGAYGGGYGRRMANTSATVNQMAPGRGQGRGAGRGAGRGQGRMLPAGQGLGLGPGQGRGLGPGQGQGLSPGGRFFIDQDNNGICDTYERNLRNK